MTQNTALLSDCLIALGIGTLEIETIPTAAPPTDEAATWLLLLWEENKKSVSKNNTKEVVSGRYLAKC